MAGPGTPRVGCVMSAFYPNHDPNTHRPSSHPPPPGLDTLEMMCVWVVLKPRYNVDEICSVSTNHSQTWGPKKRGPEEEGQLGRTRLGVSPCPRQSLVSFSVWLLGLPLTGLSSLSSTSSGFCFLVCEMGS